MIVEHYFKSRIALYMFQILSYYDSIINSVGKICRYMVQLSETVVFRQLSDYNLVLT